MKSSGVSRTIVIGIHAAFGVFAALSDTFISIWVLSFLGFSLMWLFYKRNKDGYAHYAVAYLVTLEFMTRTSGLSFPYELGKYMLLVFLGLALVIERQRKPFPVFVLLYMVMLLPSLVVLDYSNFEVARQGVVFNLFGPFSIGITIIYFYGRKINKSELEKLIFALLLPVISLMLYIVFRLPDLSNYQFDIRSNNTTSGGFGSNQVSVIMGFVFMLLPLSWILKINITKNRILNLAIPLAGAAFALLSFARGGLVSAACGTIAAFFIAYSAGQNVRQLKRIFTASIFLAVFGIVSWLYINALTHGALETRYLSTIDPSQVGHTTESINVSGRDVILTLDLEIFLSHPIIGVGPGMAKGLREELMGIYAAAHTEQTRLLAEHGIYGLIALILIYIYPIGIFRRMRLSGKILFAFLFLFGFVTMGHNSTRLALTCFVFGMAFMTYNDELVENRNPLLRQAVE